MFSEDFHTIIFAQMFGLYLFIMAIIMLSKAQYYRTMISNVQAAGGNIVIAGAIGLMLGLFLVTVHNNWVWDSDVIITLFGWLILIKSILWLGFPECMLRCTKKVYDGPAYYIILVIVAILGIILMMKGFHAFVDWNPLTAF